MGPEFGTTYAAKPATEAISTAPRRACLDLQETVRGSMLEEGGGPTKERARVKSTRGEMLAAEDTRKEARRGFLCRESRTRVGYRTNRQPRPSPLERWVYSVFFATSDGSPETANTKRSSAEESSAA